MLPVRFKEQLPQEAGSEVVLRMGFEANLQLYPMHVYKPQHDKIAGLSAFDPQHRALRRYFFSRTLFLSLDTLGRLLLPRSFLTHAGLKQGVLLIGVGDFIEMWSPQAYEKQLAETEHYSRLAKRLLDE